MMGVGRIRIRFEPTKSLRVRWPKVLAVLWMLNDHPARAELLFERVGEIRKCVVLG